MAYVYLIVEEPFAGETVKHWVKIGYSQNPPEWRMNHNQKHGNPRTIRIAAAYKYDSNAAALKAEKLAHQEFQRHLHQKEWFQIHWTKVNDWFVQQGAKLHEMPAQ